MPKLIILSNRLPVSVVKDGDQTRLQASAGGLASGLSSLLEEESTVWVGWHGGREQCSIPCSARASEFEKMQLLPVNLSEDEVKHYYDGISNATLWPLYHYLIDKLELELSGWESYTSANQKFADAVCDIYEEGDFIWVHDYHLQLVPKMIRSKLPHARIGFFLHIPFPNPDVFRILPWRDQILEGLLGADIIGFHTVTYSSNFQASVLRVLGIETFGGQIKQDGRDIRVEASPLGIDVQRIEAAHRDCETGKLDEIRASLMNMRKQGGFGHDSSTSLSTIFLAIDRMDYTKGIPRRLLAIERLFENFPDLQGKISFIQIAPPSRDTVPAYERYKETVDGMVGRINGKFGRPGYQAIHYFTRSYSQGELVELYRLVDVMLVTPLRDGMNLVAKEFIASRQDNDGVLVLSEFAGAAEELGEAILINPYDLDDSARGMVQAILMSADERTSRMKSLRQRVSHFDASTWARRFMDFLSTSTPEHPSLSFSNSPQLLELIPSGAKLKVFLDYDGTLFPIVRIPRLAKPDDALILLLAHLSKLENLEIHIVSGRSKETLSAWFGDLNIHLHAEHGALSKMAGTSDWTATSVHIDRIDWMPFVKQSLEAYCRNTPGSFIEEKQFSIVWHYRMCDPAHAENMSRSLRAHGRESFAPMGLEIVPAKKAVEIKVKGVNKGAIVRQHGRLTADEGFAIAIGDDVTDEDMFKALDHTGLSIAVGAQPSQASYRLRSPADVRLFLECIAQARLTVK